jgi:Metallo-peptidase family M12/Repeat of unknown function (DUF346)
MSFQRLLCAAGFAVALLAAPASGQVVMSPASNGDLTPAQSAAIQHLRAPRFVSNISLVRIDADALRKARPGQALTFNLNSAYALSVQSNIPEMLEQNRFVWSGDIGATANLPAGKATIVFDGADATGSITTPDGKLYQIRAAGGGVSALISVDYSKLPPDEPPQADKLGNRPPQPTQDKGDNNGDAGTTIDVLVAYTSSAQSASGNVDSLIDLAIAESNTAFTNSGVNARFRLAGKMSVNYNESGKSYSQMVSDFSGMSDVNARRNSIGADVAVLLVNNDQYCGMADAIGAVPSTAYVVVHYGCATGYYSFGHEIGHLAGARHDVAHDSTSTPFAYGHGLEYPPGGWRTIMAYACDNGSCPTRVQYWSNPSVNYSGHATGTATTENAARVWNERASVLAGFKSPPGGQWESLGGIITSNISCTTWAANRIDCFARGTDNAMYHRYWNGSAWGGWESLGGVITSDPNCVSWGANRIDCFARGTDNAMYHRYWNGSVWGGWESLGGVITTNPDCVSWGANRIDCFARGTDNAMYHRYWTGSAWGGWESLGGIITTDPECVSWGTNRIDCFVGGSDHAMYHKYWNGSTWGP